jgi:cytochrome b subunit of formate dehydrogenase
MLCKAGIVCLLVWGVAWAAPAPAAAQNEVCAACHDQEAKVKKSIHASTPCAKCHLKHEEYPHPAKVIKPDCATCHAQAVADYQRSVHGTEAAKGNGSAPDCSVCHGAIHETLSTKTAEFHKGLLDTCGMCHDKEATEFRTSIHGKALQAGVREAPACTDCHGVHQILRPKNPASTVHPTAVRETCAGCHADVRLARRFHLPADRVTSFDSSFHGLANQAGQQTVANCASCHGVHNILPSSDPASMIHPTHLATTCGACHPGAGTRFKLGKIHTVEGQQSPAPIRWALLFYLLIIPGTLGFMLLHHGGDFVRKLRVLRFAPARPVTYIRGTLGSEERMDRLERFQHFWLALSFLVLVWTGFALKYPEQFWAKPLLMFESNFPVRGTIHRVAAVVLIVVSVLHALVLALSRRHREHWKELWPRVADVREMIQGTLYRIGAVKTRPHQSSHSYVEKIEYWAVVWGTFVMGLTGVILWANQWTLQRIDKTWIDFSTTVHFYEAVLAALSILIWHFYSVIFDPEVYPLDTAWWNGKSPRLREPHEPDHKH